jgi:lipoprotein signal peptidase
MDDATKQAAMVAVLSFNVIVMIWMFATGEMESWALRAVPAVFVAGGAAAGIFFFMKRR